MLSAPLFENSHLPGWVACTFSPHEMTTTCGGDIGNPDVRFPIASITKTFTAHLCLEPEVRGLLDTPIQEVMPYFRLQDADASRQMTPRDALCHYSGLPPHTSAWVRSELSRKDFIRDRLPLLNMAGPFREKHRYSNILYAVLGQWMEEVTGVPWETQIEEKILKPLNMNSTGFLDEHWQQNAPPPHAVSPRGTTEMIPPFYARRHHVIAPASEMISPMEDLARWGQFMLSMDPEDDRWNPHNRVTEIRPFPEFGPLEYGLGWRIDSVKGEPRVWHSGHCSGFTSLLCLYPGRQYGFAAATNLSDAVQELHSLSLHITF